ncbi:MAG: enoyl-CoA hydratase-related protein [Fimbriimonadaceae bacterium]|nr:enoyl-CoA hydratase-related protein [Fimbriimonadaceae bacterium]
MLRVERRGSVVSMWLARPEVKNAFNAELIQSVSLAMRAIAEDVRAVVIAAEGTVFCAGGDLNWMRSAADQTRDENERDARELYRMLAAIRDCPVPVIARVQGACFGGGCGIVAAADIVVAQENAKFAFSEVKLGLVPATISPFVLPKIGASAARNLFTTGAVFDAAAALRIGLVHDVRDEAGLDSGVNAALAGILAASPAAVQRAKRLAMEPTLDGDAAAALLAEFRDGADGREGVTAFLEKRKPSWYEEVSE